MKKGVISVLLVMLLLLVACKPQIPGGEKPEETTALLRQVRSGSEGIAIKPLANFPPNTLYDTNEFIAIVDVQNKGAHDLDPQDCFIHVTGFDRNIITGDVDQPRSCAENVNILEGKNVYNTQGGINQIEFYSSNIILPDGVFEYNPTLNFVACYAYQTISNPSVCVDPLLYQISSEQKACDYRRSVITEGTQGAPVAVRSVRADMVTGKGKSRAVFEIDISNVGNGQVLSPDTDIRSCAVERFSYADLNKIRYNVQLSGGSLISCNPMDGFVRINNGNDSTCFVEYSHRNNSPLPAGRQGSLY